MRLSKAVVCATRTYAAAGTRLGQGMRDPENCSRHRFDSTAYFNAGACKKSVRSALRSHKEVFAPFTFSA